jgi:hypothetical protein
VQLGHLFMFVVQKFQIFLFTLFLIFLFDQEHLHPSSELVLRSKMPLYNSSFSCAPPFLLALCATILILWSRAKELRITVLDCSGW